MEMPNEQWPPRPGSAGSRTLPGNQHQLRSCAGHQLAPAAADNHSTWTPYPQRRRAEPQPRKARSHRLGISVAACADQLVCRLGLVAMRRCGLQLRHGRGQGLGGRHWRARRLYIELRYLREQPEMRHDEQPVLPVWAGLTGRY